MQHQMTQERVKELFNLDPETGVLYWKVRPHIRSAVKPGDVAGCLGENKHWRMKVDKREYVRSRVVFLFCTGILPKEVDHRNRIPTDDRPSNLRAATRSQNVSNTVRKKNTNLPRGVRQRNRKTPFWSQITVEGVTKYLGSFMTEELASRAYKVASLEYFGEFAL